MKESQKLIEDAQNKRENASKTDDHQRHKQSGKTGSERQEQGSRERKV